MSAKERDFLRSEVATLEGLLDSLSDDRVIERIGLQERLSEARKRLTALEGQALAKLLPITSRGKAGGRFGIHRCRLRVCGVEGVRRSNGYGGGEPDR